MSTYTSTRTYTFSDVQEVMRSIKADLIMIAESTKAMTEQTAINYAHDIEALAAENYLEVADVTLMNGSTEVRAIKYEFQCEGATGSARPGGVLWPLTPDGWIRINLRYTALGTPEKRAKLPLKISWVPSKTDTSHKELSSSAGRGYSSNGFGTNRKDFS
ncbi:HORMA-1 domain-containing protein [Pseudomonas aeruginosa]